MAPFLRCIQLFLTLCSNVFLEFLPVTLLRPCSGLGATSRLLTGRRLAQHLNYPGCCCIGWIDFQYLLQVGDRRTLVLFDIIIPTCQVQVGVHGLTSIFDGIRAPGCLGRRIQAARYSRQLIIRFDCNTLTAQGIILGYLALCTP